jgi:hypothetical protein
MNGQQRLDSFCGKTGRVRAAAAFGGERETMNRRVSEGGVPPGPSGHLERGRRCKGPICNVLRRRIQMARELGHLDRLTRALG